MLSQTLTDSTKCAIFIYMEIHELSPEQEQIADALFLAFNALVKHGMPVNEVAHIVVETAVEAEAMLAA